MSKGRISRRKTDVRRLIELSNANESIVLDVIESMFFVMLTDLMIKGEAYLPMVGLIKKSSRTFVIDGKKMVGNMGVISFDDGFKRVCSKIEKKEYTDITIIERMIERYILKLKDILEK